MTAISTEGGYTFGYSLKRLAKPFAGCAPRTERLQWSVMEFKRITTNPGQMGGVPCLRGLRIPVATIVGLIAEGQTTQDIVVLYPDLDADDVREALLFAAEAVRERVLPLAAGE
jgi:uncharacterized protein (DUF433 family)